MCVLPVDDESPSEQSCRSTTAVCGCGVACRISIRAQICHAHRSTLNLLLIISGNTTKGAAPGISRMEAPIAGRASSARKFSLRGISNQTKEYVSHVAQSGSSTTNRNKTAAGRAATACRLTILARAFCRRGSNIGRWVATAACSCSKSHGAKGAAADVPAAQTAQHRTIRHQRPSASVSPAESRRSSSMRRLEVRYEQRKQQQAYPGVPETGLPPGRAIPSLPAAEACCPPACLSLVLLLLLLICASPPGPPLLPGGPATAAAGAGRGSLLPR